MKYVNFSVGALCAVLLFAATCTQPDFSNPLDEKGNYFLDGDLSDADCKTASHQGGGAGFYENRCARYRFGTIISPPGSGVVSLPDTNYIVNTPITVTATANPEYDFVNWTGAPMSVNNVSSPTIQFNIAANTTITANFALKRYTLTTSAIPENGGRVHPFPVQESYAHGTQINVTATPNGGYEFTGWTGAPVGVDASSLSISFNISGNTVLTANFRRIPLTLTVNARGGWVSRHPDQNTYDAGTQVTVTANDSSGYRFTGWSGASTSTDREITVTMSTNVTLTANFDPVEPPTEPPTLAINTNPVGGGTVSCSPNPCNPDRQTFDAGTPVTVTATENPGYKFVDWRGDLASFERELSFNINSNTTLAANFKRVFTLTTIPESPTVAGLVSRHPNQDTYDAGTEVTVTAVANSWYRFVRWEGWSTSDRNEITVAMNSDVTLRAIFEPITHTLTITEPISTGGGTGGTVSPVAGTTTRNAGTSVLVMATANSGYRFTGWTGTGAPTPATTNPVTITMDGNKTLTPNFIRQWMLSVNRNPTAGGSVAGAGTYDHGASVTVTATAATNYRFIGWSDGITSATRTITMNNNITLTANFMRGFIDSRDGQVYRTVRIGNQEWMAENLNYRTADSWCYGNDPSNCNTYGRLYTWTAAMSACPVGWRLPSDANWGALVDAVGTDAGTKLKSTTGWYDGDNFYIPGTDDYGFSALPSGDRYPNGTFHNAGRSGYWWSASEDVASKARRWYMIYDYNNVDSNWGGGPADGQLYAFAVRCVHND